MNCSTAACCASPPPNPFACTLPNHCGIQLATLCTDVSYWPDVGKAYDILSRHAYGCRAFTLSGRFARLGERRQRMGTPLLVAR